MKSWQKFENNQSIRRTKIVNILIPSTKKYYLDLDVAGIRLVPLLHLLFDGAFPRTLELWVAVALVIPIAFRWFFARLPDAVKILSDIGDHPIGVNDLIDAHLHSMMMTSCLRCYLNFVKYLNVNIVSFWISSNILQKMSRYAWLNLPTRFDGLNGRAS